MQQSDFFNKFVYFGKTGAFANRVIVEPLVLVPLTRPWHIHIHHHGKIEIYFSKGNTYHNNCFVFFINIRDSQV